MQERKISNTPSCTIDLVEEWCCGIGGDEALVYEHANTLMFVRQSAAGTSTSHDYCMVNVEVNTSSLLLGVIMVDVVKKTPRG